MAVFRQSFERNLVMTLVITLVILLVIWTGASMQSTQMVVNTAVLDATGAHYLVSRLWNFRRSSWLTVA
jgi:hypothetical protein